MEKEKNMERLTEVLRMLEEIPDVVAWKVWTKDDIENCLEEDGFLPSDENVDLVMQAVYEGLSDYGTDELCDWAQCNVVYDLGMYLSG